MTEEDKSLPLSGNFMTIDGRICKIENHFDQDDFVEGEKGEIFIKHTALVRVAKTLFSIIEYNAKVLQFPQKENEWSATVSTTFVVEPLVNQNFPFDFGLAQIKKYIWTACADCNRTNAMPGFERYTTTVAETRASARALRNILGIDLCSREELADETDEIEVRAEKQQIALLERKFIEQDDFSIKDMQDILGESFDVLEDLTKNQAAKLIRELNKKKRKGKKKDK